MRIKVREPGRLQRYVVTQGPRNHLLTIRPSGFASELHYPAELFWRAVENGDLEIIHDKPRTAP